jgi:hypothetical protein
MRAINGQVDTPPLRCDRRDGRDTKWHDMVLAAPRVDKTNALNNITAH